ncbi:unnamed protein product [Hymenolepis diminuta]|uniref:BAH domain-containing protein n=1 Tax=Hymenolepis diminuta TaxID=6216 RepID=A0A564XX29_HYMDI|nr:unnamed protein product [Hymenolepis diminuta]
MRRAKATRKPPAKATKPKIKPFTKSRRKVVRKKRATRKNVHQLSYKDSHSIGRRKSTNVPTYSESGRLYYDLYVRYGLSGTFENKEEKPPKVVDHNCGFESDFSDTTTVACNENTGPSSSAKKVKIERKKKRQSVKRSQSPVKSPSSPLNSRREASLNAEAKVNMLFESTKESKNKRRSLPALPTTTIKNEESSESGDKSSCEKRTLRKRVTKARSTRLSEPPPHTIVSPKKRLAGLNATAIISACIKSPDPDRRKIRRGRPPKSSLKPPPPQKVEEVSSSKNKNVQSDPAISSPPSLSPPPVPATTSTTCQIKTPIPNTSNAITTLATVSADTKVVPASAMSTLERFQSQKVISYGPKCIGVENISRQIIHVPAQSHCAPGPSYANPVSQQLQQHQRIVSHPIASFTPPSQNHSMIMLPDSSSFSPQLPNPVTAAADMQHHPCFTTNQYYLSPFSGTGGQNQQHQTFYMSIPSPAPQFQFFSAAPFTYMQPSAQSFMPNNSYMLPMSFSPQLYSRFPFGGGCFVPRPVFAAVPQPSPQLTPSPQTSLVSGMGSPSTVNQPSQTTQRIDRAVSPIALAPSTSTPVKKPSSSKRNSATVSTATAAMNAPEKEKPSPCLWKWVGEPIEKRVFLKPNSPPVTRLCYPSMRHQKDGMVVSPGDNVLLCSGPDRQGAPHVAKVTALFNDPDSGTKMMALLWYYRPESLVPPRRNGVIDCELFASRHCDVNPVDCIDDLAYVYSALPYARFMALAKYKQECRTHRRSISIVPPLHKTSKDAAITSTSSKVNPSGDVSEFPEEAVISNVFLCRAWYDFHSRRVMRNLKTLNNSHNITIMTTSTTNNNGSTTTRQQHPQPVTSSSPVGQTTRPDVFESTAIQPSAEEDLSNGRAVLETTAELSINWADHGEQIAMSLGGGRGLVSRPSPSPRKKQDI